MMFRTFLARIKARRRAAVNANGRATKTASRSPGADAAGEERLALAMNATRDGLWDWNLRTGAAWFSSVWRDIIGFTALEMESYQWRDYVHPADLRQIEDDIADHLAGRKPFFEGIFRHAHKDGRWLWIEARGQCLRDSAGRPERFTGRFTDISKRKRAEALQMESEKRFRDFATASSDWFWEMGPDLRFTWFSDRVEVTTGTSISTFLHRTRAEVANADPNSPQWREHEATLRARKPFRNFCYPITAADGTQTFISVSGVPIVDAEGGFQGYRGTAANVTAQIESERKLAQASEQLQDAVDSFADGFALFDADDRLLLYNDKYRIAASDAATVLQPGTRFEDVFRVLVKSGRIKPSEKNKSRWIRARLAERRRPNVMRSFETADGRWIEEREYATREGGRAIIRTDITERRRAETAVRESEASLANAQRIAHIGNWDLRLPFRRMTWSDEVHRILGQSPASFRPSLANFVAAVDDADRERVAAAVDAALAGLAPLAIEHRVRRPDGTVRAVRQQGEVLFSATGHPLRMTGIVHDITERKLAKQKIEEAEEQLRVAFDTIPDSVTVSRLKDGVFIEVNSGFTALTGRSKQEAIGRSSLEFGFWKDAAARDAFVRGVEAHGQVRDLEIELRHADGGKRNALLSASLVNLADEPRILMITKDITERKQAEQELRKLWRAVEQGPAAVLITDPDGVIEYVNPKFAEMTGYDVAEVIGRTPRLLQSGVMAPELYAELWSTIRMGREWRGEFCNQRKDGTLFWTHSLISPIKDPDNVTTHFVGIETDVTRRKLAEEQLRASEERFRCLVESAVLGIVIDCHGKPLFANQTYADIFGYARPDDILAMDSLDPLYAGDDLARIRRYRSARIEGRHAPSEYEFRGVKKDGTHIWVRTQLNVIRWNDAPAVQSVVVDITLRKLYEERLHYQANFDAVTELPNRSLALDRLNHAIASAHRHDRKVAVLFIDVDHFKKINDTLGHAVGDTFLRQAAERLKNCIRGEDTVARLGGDEFTIILPDVHGSDDVEAVARKVLDAFAQPFLLDGHEAFVSASIGITLCPDDGISADVLMRNADAAMYQAKERGRGMLGFFTRELNERARLRMGREAQLRHALARDQLSLHYQPLIDIRTMDVIGAEALLRWDLSESEAISPAEFIPLAEDSGLIVPIGAWVLKTACASAKRWHGRFGRPLRMAVNVSSRQFRGASLVSAIEDALSESGLAAALLELEITEGLLMEDIVETMTTIGDLEKRGIRLSVDDFGTGFSSLSYLTRFPLDTLKIDRSFTNSEGADRAGAPLVEAIIAMGHHLDLCVVAEGVETRTQLDFLRQRRCDVAQGFFFSPPLPEDAFIDWVEAWQPFAIKVV